MGPRIRLVSATLPSVAHYASRLRGRRNSAVSGKEDDAEDGESGGGQGHDALPTARGMSGREPARVYQVNGPN